MSDAQIDAKGVKRTPISGWPFAVKEVFDVAGVVTSGGSKAYDDRLSYNANLRNAWDVHRQTGRGLITGRQDDWANPRVAKFHFPKSAHPTVPDADASAVLSHASTLRTDRNKRYSAASETTASPDLVSLQDDMRPVPKRPL